MSLALFNIWFPAIVVALLLMIFWDCSRRGFWRFVDKIFPGILEQVGLPRSSPQEVGLVNLSQSLLPEVGVESRSQSLPPEVGLVNLSQSRAEAVAQDRESFDGLSQIAINMNLLVSPESSNSGATAAFNLEAQPEINAHHAATETSADEGTCPGEVITPVTLFLPDGASEDVTRRAREACESLANGQVIELRSSIILQAAIGIDACVLAKIVELAKYCLQKENRCVFQLGNWAVLYHNAGKVQMQLLKEGNVPVNVEARWQDGKTGIMMRGLYLTGSQVKIGTKWTSKILRSIGPANQGVGDLDELHLRAGEFDVQRDSLIYASKVVVLDGFSLIVRSEASSILPPREKNALIEAVWTRWLQISNSTKKMLRSLFFGAEDFQPKSAANRPELEFDPEQLELSVEHWQGLSEIELLNTRKEVLLYLQEQRASGIIEYAGSPSPDSHLIFVRDEHYLECWREGLQVLNEVIHRNSNDSHSHTHIRVRGGIQFLLGDFESALQDYDLVHLNTGGHQSTVLLERALVKCMLGRHLEAMQDVLAVITLNPNMNDIQELQTSIKQILDEQILFRLVGQIGPSSQRPLQLHQDSSIVEIPDLLTGDEWRTGEIGYLCPISDTGTGRSSASDPPPKRATAVDCPDVEGGVKFHSIPWIADVAAAGTSSPTSDGNGLNRQCGSDARTNPRMSIPANDKPQTSRQTRSPSASGVDSVFPSICENSASAGASTVDSSSMNAYDWKSIYELVPSEEDCSLPTVPELPLQSKHRIFLSHSGAQSNFVDQLCLDLEQQLHQTPFLDKGFRRRSKGEDFILLTAQQCDLAIVVLSEEYFSQSKWPMLELSALIHSTKCSILPLFFGLSFKEFKDAERRESWFQTWEAWAQNDARVSVMDWKLALREVERRMGLEYVAAVGEVWFQKILATVSAVRVGGGGEGEDDRKSTYELVQPRRYRPATVPDLSLQSKHRIFVSHSLAQNNSVVLMCLDLEDQHHYTPFFGKPYDSLPKGEIIPQSLFKAAQQCDLAIVVLSEEYFSRSKWPMLELSALVQSRKRKILPLFFGLSCKEFRDAERRERWFQTWEAWAQIDPSVSVTDWKFALREVERRRGLEYVAQVERRRGLGYGWEGRFRDEVLATISGEDKWKYMEQDLSSIMDFRLGGRREGSTPFTWAEATDIMLQIAEHIAFMHVHNVAHCDLKSQKILCTRLHILAEPELGFLPDRYYSVKLAGSGVVRSQIQSSDGETLMSGTSHYQPPEMLEVRELVGKADAYSFGKVCYEILTGKLPFEGYQNEHLDPRLSLDNLPPRYSPEALKKLIRQCLDSNPAQRPSFDHIVTKLTECKLQVDEDWEAWHRSN